MCALLKISLCIELNYYYYLWIARRVPYLLSYTHMVAHVKPQSPARATSALTCRANPPAPGLVKF